MVTYEQALTAKEFHFAPACDLSESKRGTIYIKRERWRRNGATKTWKTRPGEFSIPIKFGLYSYAYITHENADQFHTEEDCPAFQAAYGQWVIVQDRTCLKKGKTHGTSK